jgi:hypothetical protein
LLLRGLLHVLQSCYLGRGASSRRSCFCSCLCFCLLSNFCCYTCSYLSLGLSCIATLSLSLDSRRHHYLLALLLLFGIPFPRIKRHIDRTDIRLVGRI